MTILESAAGALAALLIVAIAIRGVLTHRRVQAAVSRVLRRHRS